MGARRTNAEHAYVVAYDISDPKRWRRVFRLMKGYGQWLQLSVFHCRLDGGRTGPEMTMGLEALIAPAEDHVPSILTSAPPRKSASPWRAWKKPITEFSAER